MKNSAFGAVAKVVGVVAGVTVIAGGIWASLRDEPPPSFATAPAAIADIEATVLAAGILEASRMVSVGAQVSGQIKSLRVKLGDKVKAGDAIAEIDAITQENELRNAQAALASVKAQRSVQQASLKEASLAFERQRMMLAEEASSRADFESAEAVLQSTRAQIEALDAQIEQASARVDTALANLSYTKIRAPMDGTVVALVAKEGQTVNANQSAPTIVKLAKLDVMTVSAEISEADVIRVRPGQTVYFTILGDPLKRYYAKLRTVEPAPESIQSETTSSASSSASSTTKATYYNGLFEVPNPNSELRISMTAQVSVVLGEAKGALTIPSSALGERDSDGAHLVTVIGDDGTPSQRRVTIGIDNNVNAQVLEGVSEGEKVVVGEATAKADSGQGGGGGGGRRRSLFY
ncbi:efflux RND transporter periplasmic adaptor subunit [Steroidobacter sp.]|uniref:efflux RND transporter periplasmic adaptor subunit n=1 Tax=Steroidobacter sp. TaxID=1978227 RepID=UPI001A42F9A6|nr:efflux RND transporter periplasmic adaptor subunit [Steroidobacter sp.]MBL8267736.1 efflux RND transporter periplasmic adaptor subunit [Steroidobacter sp.]